MTVDFVTTATHDQQRKPIMFPCPTCSTYVRQSELLRHIALCDVDTASEGEDTTESTSVPQSDAQPSLSHMWGQTLGRTFRNKKFKWGSRVIMFPLVFFTLPAPAVGSIFVLWCVWRMVRLVIEIKNMIATMRKRHAERKAQSVDGERKARTFSIEINIG